jgi:hypothetical protein
MVSPINEQKIYASHLYSAGRDRFMRSPVFRVEIRVALPRFALPLLVALVGGA